MDVVAVVGTGEHARVGRVRVRAIDQLGRAGRARDGGELADQVGAPAAAGAPADLSVDGADVRRAARLVAGPRRVIGT